MVPSRFSICTTKRGVVEITFVIPDKLFAKANNLSGMTGVVVISVDEWEHSKGYIIAIQEKTVFGYE